MSCCLVVCRLETFKVYHCKNNMWDIATPIMVDDKHLGNIFRAVFFRRRDVDYELFKKQARQYGFNETEYLAPLTAFHGLAGKRSIVPWPFILSSPV